MGVANSRTRLSDFHFPLAAAESKARNRGGGGEWAGPLNGVRVGSQMGEVGEWLTVVCPHPLWCCVQGSCTVSYSCSWHLRRDSWILAFLCVIVHNLPHLCMHAVIFSPFYFICINIFFAVQRGVCPGTSTLVKGPRSQPISPLPLCIYSFRM